MTQRAWITFGVLLGVLILGAQLFNRFIAQSRTRLEADNDARFAEMHETRLQMEVRLRQHTRAGSTREQVQANFGIELVTAPSHPLSGMPMDWYRLNSRTEPLTYFIGFRDDKATSYSSSWNWSPVPPKGWWSWPRRIRDYMLMLCWPLWVIAMIGAICEPSVRRRLAQYALAIALAYAALSWLSPWKSTHLYVSLAFSLTSGVVLLLRRRSRRDDDICPHCRYNLTGNKSGVCPECGMITPAEITHRHLSATAQHAEALDAMAPYNPPDAQDNRMDRPYR